MPWGTSGHCLLMIEQLCLQSTDLQFDLKSFLSSVSDPKAVTNSACCLFYVSHYRAIHILLFFSFFSPPPTFINKLRQSIPNHGRKLQIKTSVLDFYFFLFIKISGGRFTPSRFSIWYPEVNIWPWLALNRLQWRLKYWIESRLENSTNSLPIHFILSDYII